MADARTYY